MTPITERDKKVLIGGGIFVILYILVIYVAQPIYKKQKNTVQEIENKILFIEKYYAVVNQKNLYESQDKVNKDFGASLTQRFLAETQPGLATAEMQKILEDISRQAGVQLPRVRVEKMKYIETLLAVPVELTLKSTMRSLTEFIRLVESHEKFMIIQEVNTRVVNKTDPEQLQTRLLIAGFIQQFEPEKNKRA